MASDGLNMTTPEDKTIIHVGPDFKPFTPSINDVVMIQPMTESEFTIPWIRAENNTAKPTIEEIISTCSIIDNAPVLSIFLISEDVVETYGLLRSLF